MRALDPTTSIDERRRRFLGSAAMALAAAPLLTPSSAGSQSLPATAVSTLVPSAPTGALYGPLRQVDAGPLRIGYVEAGPARGDVVVLLHGWPYDIHSFVDVAPRLSSAGYRVVVPYLRGYGTTRFLSDATLRNGQQSALASDVVALMDALKIPTAIVAGFDWGARTAGVVAALWPERCRGLVSVGGYLITDLATSMQPLPPSAELNPWWYQYYFATERGRAGYDKYRRDFGRLIWTIASPKWRFDDATFERTATAFDNPDHVDIVIHNYRWRLGLAPGEAQYDEFESKLALRPVISVPTITIASDFDGAGADGAAYARLFTGQYTHMILHGIGHNVPQEAPQAFADAVIAVGRR